MLGVVGVWKGFEGTDAESRVFETWKHGCDVFI